MKENLKKYGVYFVPGIICVILLLIVYAVKGIYPFGSMTIVHGDLGQIFINNYHYLYDSVKTGNLSNLLFTNLLYGGSNIWGTEVVSGFFSPFSILIFLCNNRENLIYFFSYILLIKVFCISISAYFFFDKVYKDSNKIWKILFSAIYALSGYVILNYTTIIWLDLACIFPILIYSLKRVFDTGKFLMYSILLALCFVISYQLTYMTIFMILAIMPFVLKYYVAKERRKEVVVALGIGTVIALLIPCVLFLPAIEIYLNSFRTSIELNYSKLSMDTFSTKLSYLFFAALPIVGFIKGFKYIKKDNTIKCLYLAFTVIGLIPIFFEEVNKLWHGGSYDGFPFRYGYMPIFVLINIAMYYFTKYFEKDNFNIKLKEEKIKNSITFKFVILTILEVLINILFIGSCIYVAYNFNKSVPAFKTETNILLAMIVMIGITVFYEMYFIAKKNKHLYKIITFLTILEIFVAALGCVGIQEKYRDGADHSDHSIFEANSIMKETPSVDNGMYRFKDADGILLENTALITRFPSISSWLLTTKEQVNAHQLLGYSKYDFKVDSLGGTIFSDSLLNAKYIFTKDIYSSSIYNRITYMDNGNVNLYELKNVLPVGLVFDSKTDLTDIPTNITDLETQNYLYQNLFNKSDDLIKILNAQDIILNKNEKQITENDDGTLSLDLSKYNQLNFNIDVQGEKKLYLNIEELSNSNTFLVLVNDKLKVVHTMNDYRTITHGYPNNFNNGILDLGLYTDETVNIKLISVGRFNCNSIQFGLFDIEKYNEICKNATSTTVSQNSNGSDIKIETVAQEGQKMFLPISYDKKWECYVNGEKKDVQRILTGFIAIDLNDGQDNIELRYVNNTFKYGSILSIIGIILFILMFFINKNNRIIKNKLLQNILYIGFLGIEVIFFLIIYGYGIIKSILNCILFIINMC